MREFKEESILKMVKENKKLWPLFISKLKPCCSNCVHMYEYEDCYLCPELSAKFGINPYYDMPEIEISDPDKFFCQLFKEKEEVKEVV